MKTKGYLEHLDLGNDPESGLPNILVQSLEEYRALPADQKAGAWATLKVASVISERTAASLYKAAYQRRIESKNVKKKETDRIGILLVKLPSVRTNAKKRDEDITRLVRVFRRKLKATCWLPESQSVLVSAIVDMRLRNIERELFQSNTKEGNNGSHEGN
jgi:hypothetical protein